MRIDAGGATFDTNGNDITFSSPVGESLTGALKKAGAGTLTLASSNTFTGVLQVNGGTVAFTTLTNLGAGNAITIDGGALKWNGTTDISTRTVTIGSNGATFDTNGDDVTLANAIGNNGTGGLTKTGTGTLTLASAPAYAGDTAIAAGTLSVNQTSFIDTADVSIDDGATLDLNFTGTDIVNELFIGGQRQVRGTWGSLTSDATNKTSLITGAGVLQVNEGVTYFDAWASSSGLTGAEALSDADPDGDGLANVLEWLLGGDPLAQDAPGRQPVVSQGGGFLTVTFSRNDDSESELETSVQYSTDFVSWTDVHVTSNEWTLPDGTSHTIVENGSAADTITVKIPTGSNTRMFVRLFSAIE